MQITNKNICKIHNTYAVLYTQGPLASVGNVSPDEGIDIPGIVRPVLRFKISLVEARDVVVQSKLDVSD
jgi:hypothetical protein